MPCRPRLRRNRSRLRHSKWQRRRGPRLYRVGSHRRNISHPFAVILPHYLLRSAHAQTAQGRNSGSSGAAGNGVRRRRLLLSDSTHGHAGAGPPLISAQSVCAVTAGEATLPPTFTVVTIPEGDPLHGIFNTCMKTFGISHLAAAGYPDTNLLHVSTVTAEYLDNDENGFPDNSAANMALQSNSATFVHVSAAGGYDDWGAVRDLPLVSVQIFPENGSCVRVQNSSPLIRNYTRS
jgi:hypothetical protein